MKILSCTQQKEADAYTIEHQSILSINLIEKAASELAYKISHRWNNSRRFVIFAGPGNNGCDALAVARMLFLKNYQVEVVFFNINRQPSQENLTNIQRLQECGCANYTEVTTEFNPPVLGKNDIVIDGLFGSGLNRPLEGGFASVVKYINASEATVVAIDIPSGLMGEDNTMNIRQNIIKADVTYTIQFPKLAFFFAENEEFVGEWEVVNIGISPEYSEQAVTKYFLTEENDVRDLLKPRKKFAHKGNFGHALLIAGSYGMGGASVLAAKSCLRTGVGLLSIHAPICNHMLLQMSVPEAMVLDDVHELFFAEAEDLDNFQAVGIGPGLGQDAATARAVIDQVSNCYLPMVLDADALNIFSTHRNYLTRIPRGSILTPHVKEFERLVGRCSNSYERLTKAKELAAYLQCYIVLKGAWTAIVTPEGNFHINTTGNPGMATAGSGDVLTGILTSLLAQGLSSEDACKLGVLLHGKAGDIAAKKYGEISMTSSDIIEALPEALKSLTE